MSPEQGSRPARRWPDRVQDVIVAAEEILHFLEGHTLDSFRADARTVKAVLADFAIIGEAVAHNPEQVRARYSAVPWRAIRDMRNIISHV